MLPCPDNAMYMLAGPTAVGKSAVAHHLALKHGASILSVDSMQVYRGMDVGTAKPSQGERDEVVYGGIDLLEVVEAFDLAQYLRAASDFYQQVHAAGPIISTGGTGLYFNALLHGLGPSGPDAEQRDKLEQLFSESGVGGLQQALKAADPAWYAQLSDQENPRRLMRALEQSAAGEGQPNQWKNQEASPMVVLRMDRAALLERIERRVDRMLDQGLLDEVRRLAANWPVWSRSALQSIGYKEVLEHLEGALTLAETRERIIIRTRRLAKRQMTWFRHQGPVEWIDVEPQESVEEVASQVEAAWRRWGPCEVRL